MQLVVFALLGCCVVAHSASLSDTLAVSKSLEERSSSALGSDLESLESSGIAVEYTQDDNIREKRSGSGGFFAGIGSAILGKVAQASSGISKGSSDGSSSGRDEHHAGYESVEYGAPVHNYDESNFDIWSFKKAIINTLFQALKAIGGGVIALKGKLIKGGGIVISAKGNIISAKGDAISHLGRQIAASAVLTPPKTEHTYVYEAPAAVHHVVTPDHHHESYGVAPPTGYGHHSAGYAGTAVSSDSYGHHSGYASPSDDAAGLLILKSLQGKSNDQHYETGSHENQQSSSSSGLASIAQAIVNKKTAGIKNIVNKIAEASNSIKGLKNFGETSTKASSAGVEYEVSHSDDHVEHKEQQLAPIYGPALFNNGNDHHHPIQETHVIHNEGNSGNSDVHLGGGESVSSVSGDHHNSHNSYQQFGSQNQNQNIGFGVSGIHGSDGNQLSQNNNYAGIENGHNLIFGTHNYNQPAEIPILQSLHNQPLYFSQPAHNQLQNFNNYYPHNSYNGILRRNGRLGIQNDASDSVVFSYAYYPNVRPDGNVQYHAVNPNYHAANYN